MNILFEGSVSRRKDKQDEKLNLLFAALRTTFSCEKIYKLLSGSKKSQVKFEVLYKCVQMIYYINVFKSRKQANIHLADTHIVLHIYQMGIGTFCFMSPAFLMPHASEI